LLFIHGTVLVALPVLGGLPLLLPGLTILGFADGTLLVIVMTVMQQLAPREMLGRVMATMAFMQVGTFPISVALAGFAVGRWGLVATFVAGGAGVLIVALLGVTRRAVRNA
jgi:hypothetical protein